MSNSFNFNRANQNTPNEAGWCQRWASQGFGLGAVYASAYAAWQACTTKRGGLPPNDGNYYLIYFDGYWNGQKYGDVALYQNGRVWSGSNPKWRSGTDYETYKRWIGQTYLGWSEFNGKYRIATIPTAPVQPAPTLALIPQNGTFRAYGGNRVRRQPSLNGQIVAAYVRNETVAYDYYVDNEGIRWISYIGKSGNRNYIARRKLDGSEVYGDAF